MISRVHKDPCAVSQNQEVFLAHGLAGRGFVHVGSVTAWCVILEAVLDSARQRFGVAFEGPSVTVCHGIAEYFDIGFKNERIALGDALRDLRLHAAGRAAGDQPDRLSRSGEVSGARPVVVYAVLRSGEELAAEVDKAGWQLSICEHEPMRLITMCLAVKSAAPACGSIAPAA